MEKDTQTAPKRALIKPSLVAWVKETRKVKGYSFFDLLHGLVYIRFPYLYIGVGTGEHKLTKWLAPVFNLATRLFPAKNLEGGAPKPANLDFADGYHGKVVPLQAASQLVQVKQNITIPDLEHIIPYPRARAIVLQNPDHIVALDCPCRMARKDPCLPLDVCLIIGEPFASFVSEHHPNHTRWITSDEAVGILQAEEQRGHVHHAFFKDAMLSRFYAICNCCACCCGAMQAHQHGTPMLASSGFVAQVDPALCLACGTCHEFCQFGALSLGAQYSEVDADLCMGCGICVSHCEHGALSLRRESSKGEPLEIMKLMESVSKMM